MGRQKGQSQRTKGNVRPSSSRQAARLIADDQRFVGFDAMSGDLGYVPVLKSLDDEKDARIDSDFRVSLSKLSKRDVTTKLKALSEISALCQNKKVDDTLTILPYWPRLYNRLCEDSDRKVRESVQSAHNALVSAVGKNIAPHLKSILPYWWIAQSDTFPPAAAAALKAFQAAFPTAEKQNKALAFGSQEILQCINKNIFVSTKSQQSSSASEDPEMNMEKIISMNLSALASFLQTLSFADVAVVPVENLEVIYSNQRLWKFSKHKSAAIRASFYTLLSAFCSYIPEKVSLFVPKISVCVMHKIDESNPLVCRSLWEAVESLTSAFSSWHQHIDIRKGFLPQLWSLLKAACHGNARIICPRIVPLLSCFPPSLSVYPVYKELFKCFTTALQSEMALRSLGEIKAIVTAFVECMQYVVRRSIESCEDTNWSTINLVIKENLLPMMHSSLNASDFPQFLRGPLYQLFAQFLETISAKVNIHVEQDSYIKVCLSIWKDLQDLGVDTILISKAENTISESFVSFLRLLEIVSSYSMTVLTHKTEVADQKHVKFFDESSVTETGKPIQKHDGNHNIKNMLLYNDVATCLKICIGHILDDETANVSWKIRILSCIFSKFTTKRLFEKLFDCVEKDTDLVLLFLIQKILPIVKSLSPNVCTTEEKQSIASVLNSLIQCCSTEVLELLVTLFSEPQWYGGKDVSLYLAQNFVNNQLKLLSLNCDWFISFLLEIIHDLESKETDLVEEKWGLLFSALTAHAEKPLLDSSSVCTVLRALGALLSRSSSVQNAVKVNEVCFSCFAVYVNCMEVIDCTNSVLQVVLCNLLELACKEPQQLLLTTLKDSLGSLLKACYQNDSTAVKSICEGLYQKTSAYLTELIFREDTTLYNLTAFPDIVRVFAEELVMHHSKQDFVMEWLDCLLPSHDLMLKLRPKFSCSSWCGYLFIVNGVQNDTLLETVSQRYLDVVGIYSKTCNELWTIFSETHCSLAEHEKLQDMFIETLLASLFPLQHREALVIPPECHPEFMDKVLSKVVENSVKTGNAWLLMFDQFSRIFLPYLKDDVIFHYFSFDQSEITEAFAGTMVVYVRNSCELSRVETILNWSLSLLLEQDPNASDVMNTSLLARPLFVVAFSISQLNKLHNSCEMSYNANQRSTVYQKITELLFQWKSSNNSLFLFDCDFNVASSPHKELNIAIIQCLQSLIESDACNLTSETWDFIQCSFVSWIESCGTTFTNLNYNYHRDSIFLFHSLCFLMKSLEGFMSSTVATNDPTVSPSLFREWNEFFKPAVHVVLIPIFVSFAKNKRCLLQSSLQLIGDCLKNVTFATLLSSATSFETYLNPNSALINTFQTLLHHFSALLIPVEDGSDCIVQQMMAYSLFTTLFQDLFSVQHGNPPASIRPPEHLLEVLLFVKDEVTKSLKLLKENEVKLRPVSKQVTGSREIEDFSDVSSDESETESKSVTAERNFIAISNIPYIRSYLLTWKLLVSLIRQTPSESKSQYIARLADNPRHTISDLLSNLKQLLPVSPLKASTDSEEGVKSNMFSTPVNFLDAGTPVSVAQHLACAVLKDVVLNLQAYVRTWFNSLNKLDRANIDGYISRYLSPIICKEELEMVSQFKAPPGLEVRSRRATREVVAIYEVSEANFEISIQLPSNYPLTPVQVNTVRRVGVAASQWRYWILQMTMLLQHQNGNIVDALLLWKQKVDKRLDGLEECMICFSIVHGANAQSLPKLQCKTCHKKYHAECLYKWFDTSNQSTCPLCRSPMMFK